MLDRLVLATRIVFKLYKLIFNALWAISAALVTRISRNSRPSTEEKARALEPTPQTGGIEKGQSCPQCGTANEATAKACFNCGTSLLSASIQ